MRFVEWGAAELLPTQWGSGNGARVFNPGLLRHGAGYILAYRVVLEDGRRRIGICRLDADFRVEPGTPTAWSDHVDGVNWFADPRLYLLDGHVFVHWNTGWGDGENEQFLQELDPARLLPAGEIRTLRLDGPRQQIEKNWVLFGEPAGRAIYFPRPLRMLRYDWPLTSFRLEPERPWDDHGFESRYGPIRGGAPPAPDGDGYWFVGHTVGHAPEGFRYWPVVFRFTEDGEVTGRPLAPLPLPNPYRCRRRLPRLNPYVGQVVYPCGMARAADGWAVSYGINDERCALAVLTNQELAAAVESVPK